MTSLDAFGGPWAPFWHHFAIKWVTDAHRWILEGPRMDFIGPPLAPGGIGCVQHAMVFSSVASAVHYQGYR